MIRVITKLLKIIRFLLKFFMYSEFHVNMRTVFSLYITNWRYESNEILSFSSSQCKVFLYQTLLEVSIKNTPSSDKKSKTNLIPENKT